MCLKQIFGPILSPIRFIHTLVLLLLCCPATLAQGQITLSGYISDAATGERLIGVNLTEMRQQSGASTNTYGFFSLRLPEGPAQIVVSYIGYEPDTLNSYFQQDSSLHIQLRPNLYQLQEVTVSGAREKLRSPEMSTISLRPREIKNLPALMGETDVLKAIQLMPGVQPGQEGFSDLNVRGGGPDQNLMLLDGVTVYNSSHLLGFISIYDANAIKRVNLTKGGFPARYGGRLSSIIDVQLKEGNNQRLTGEGSVGLISSKVLIEGPIKSDRTSFLISARRTYFDVLAVMAQAMGGQDISSYNFHDAVLKINHTFSKRDRLYLSLYGGRDKFFTNYTYRPRFDTEQKESFRLRWGNATAALRWNHLFSDRLFSNLALTFSNYNFRVGAESESSGNQEGVISSQVGYSSLVRDYGLKLDFDYFASSRHALKFGVNAVLHQFKPNAISYSMTGGESVQDSTFFDARIPATEGFVYLEDEVKLNDQLKANLGMHFSLFHVRNTTYTSAQPRLSLSHLLGSRAALKASFATMTQFIHLLSNASVGMPTDIWVPATDRIRPQQSWQAALAYQQELSSKIDLSIEGYYKDMRHVVEFSQGTDFLKDGPETNFLLETNVDWESRITSGRGWAYGTEVLLRKNAGLVDGWLGYTLSWSNRQFEALNQGRPFPYLYDRRHNVSVVGNYKLRDNIRLGGVFVFSSGMNTTLPEASYLPYEEGPRDPHSSYHTQVIDYLGERNNYRLPAYHRLDLSIGFLKMKKRGEREWNISVYNAYNRRNTYFVYVGGSRTNTSPGTSSTQSRQLFQVSLFTIIPSVSYRFKFN
jgi:hypothetical protein